MIYISCAQTSRQSVRSCVTAASSESCLLCDEGRGQRKAASHTEVPTCSHTRSGRFVTELTVSFGYLKVVMFASWPWSRLSQTLHLLIPNSNHSDNSWTPSVNLWDQCVSAGEIMTSRYSTSDLELVERQNSTHPLVQTWQWASRLLFPL